MGTGTAGAPPPLRGHERCETLSPFYRERNSAALPATRGPSPAPNCPTCAPHDEGRRNFELGLLTSDEPWRDVAQAHFDSSPTNEREGASRESSFVRRERTLFRRELHLLSMGPSNALLGDRNGACSPGALWE